MIDEFIDKNKPIKIKIFSVSNAIEHYVKAILEKILSKYSFEPLLIPLYTILKELIVNAVKANHKYLFFEGKKDYENIYLDNDKTLQLFKLEITRQDIQYLDSLARRKNIYAELKIINNNNQLEITVENPTPMSKLELEVVNKKLDIAKHCNDISDYFILSNDDDYKEGAGLGLIIVIMMLKSMGLDENAFKLFSNIHKTIAKLSIPLENHILESYKKSIENNIGQSA